MSINSDIKRYWENESEGYKQCVQGELDGFKKEAWKQVLRRVIQEDAHLNTLDIGTGPGFFAILMAEMGCSVTAIDLTNNMIQEARALSGAHGQIRFETMDSHDLEFEANTFDMLICRNVTWTLDDPPRAYREWFRVLKPGGNLVIFDANYNRRYFFPEIEALYQENLKRAKEKGLVRKGHKDKKLEAYLAKRLFLSDKLRPQWDLNEMLQIGFQQFCVDMNFDEYILTEADRLFWGHAPAFMIIATK